jgi:hypothetical protein
VLSFVLMLPRIPVKEGALLVRDSLGVWVTGRLDGTWRVGA